MGKSFETQTWYIVEQECSFDWTKKKLANLRETLELKMLEA